MRKVVLLSSVVVVGWVFSEFGESGEALAQCVATQDCASLGYTESSCANGGLKCPFGNTWSCKENTSASTPAEPEAPTAAVLGECNGYAKNCSIGQILNRDGTCTTDVVSGKTPIAVIIYIGGDGCGQALAIKQIKQNIAWGGYGTDISDLPNYKSSSEVITDYDSCGNTQKITQQGDSSKYPAAWAAVNYSPDLALETKGKWCLPAPGIFSNTYSNMNVINNAMSKLNGTQLGNEYIWLSAEYSASYAWEFSTYDGNFIGNYSKATISSNIVVRPVLEF